MHCDLEASTGVQSIRGLMNGEQCRPNGPLKLGKDFTLVCSPLQTLRPH